MSPRRSAFWRVPPLRLLNPANPALSCSVPTIYNVNQTGDLYALNYAATPPADSPATPSTIGGVTSEHQRPRNLS